MAAMGVATRIPDVTYVRFRKQFRKTDVCAFFERGWCFKRDRCEFAHGAAELGVGPDLKKTSVCKAW
eukprot:CAMPEP_0177537748 /NCGR_PEP_ID=MMETSP0369-20130122/57953_1 /TAXON_ID=447022 ORGANISM="Scrippsiella hangoei-like, Strain SHHI-4" /NCGR_SAMPLE_ID=MMETSP0369 /ASSEMBLY_ACC=CAM_ASM_000364 /LENGTH=66 /DNA_ID=CAMNT_0019020401 /DNA_START=101 /DNA_END=298 /DNA_ORIENTATION=+